MWCLSHQQTPNDKSSDIFLSRKLRPDDTQLGLSSAASLGQLFDETKLYTWFPAIYVDKFMKKTDVEAM